MPDKKILIISGSNIAEIPFLNLFDMFGNLSPNEQTSPNQTNLSSDIINVSGNGEGGFVNIDSVPNFSDGECGAVIIKAHASNPKNNRGKLIIRLLGDCVEQDQEALDQIIAIQKRTKAPNIYLFSCFPGTLVNSIKKAGSNRGKKLELENGTQIMTFGSSKHPVFYALTSQITQRIVEQDGQISDELAREISLEFGITVKYCAVKDEKVEVGKHNLHKFPLLYAKLYYPENQEFSKKWKNSKIEFSQLGKLKKEGRVLLDYQEKEFKQLQDMFRLYELYKENPPKIPESFPNQALVESVNRYKNDRIDGWVELGADVNYIEKTGHPALMIMIDPDGDIGVLNQLLSKGADPDIQNPQTGNTALIESIKKGRFDLAEALLENGADPDIQNHNGETALMITPFREGGKEMVEILLSFNANAGLKNNDKKTAIDLTKNPEIKKILIDSLTPSKTIKPDHKEHLIINAKKSKL